MGKKSFNIIRKIDFLRDAILEAVFPKDKLCLICCKEKVFGICSSCLDKIVICSDDSFSYAYYGGSIKKLIFNFKFKKDFNSGELLVDFLLEKIKNIELEDYIITYVPIRNKSYKSRGFNQCEYLAKNLGKKLNIEVYDLLEFKKDIEEQKTLNSKDRADNIKDAVKCKNLRYILNRNILLVDDIYTTGATLNECKKILILNGAFKIKFLTIAKSDI